MRVLIENYRGFEIFFDTERERFYCEIDNEKWDERQSFNAAKKFVDETIKANGAFKPFDVIVKRDEYGEKRLTIIGVRKDGNFIAKKENGEQMVVSRFDENKYMLDIDENNETLGRIAILEAEDEMEHKRMRDKIRELEKQLKIVSLKELKQKYAPPK